MRIRLRFIVVEAPAGLSLDANGCLVVDLADGATVDQALASLVLPKGTPYLTLVNEESIPVAARPARHLRDDDLLTVFSPLKGG